MANKPRNPIPVAVPKHTTEEEEMMKRLAYFAQRREGIAVNILCSLIQGTLANNECSKADCLLVTDLSVEMADKLLERLYPKPEEKK